MSGWPGTVGGVATRFDHYSDRELTHHLTRIAEQRGERFVVEERDGQWYAEFRTPSELAGEIVPVGDEYVRLGDEVVMVGINGPDAHTAMVRLADHIAHS